MNFARLAKEGRQQASTRLLRHMHVQSNILEGVFALRAFSPDRSGVF
jgi:hypothetical protein